MKQTKTVFAFDLHKVIFEYDYQCALKLITSELPLRELPWFTIRPFFWWELLSTSRRTRVIDDIFEKVENKYPRGSRLWPFGHKLANCQKPQLETIKLIADLKKNGHKLYLLSNIGPVSLKDLRNRFGEIFELFDGTFTPQKDQNYIQKPHPSFYQNFKTVVQKKHGDVSIILIDDRLTNITSAQQEGLKTVHFTTVEKLKNYLYKHEFIK